MRRNLAHLARSIPLHALALLAIGLSASAGGVSAPTAGIAEASALGAPDAGAIAPALELAPLPAPGPRAALYSHATLPSPLADHALRAVLTGTASQHASAPAADVDVIAREPNRIAEASAVATTTIDPARASPRLPPARAVHLPRYPLT